MVGNKFSAGMKPFIQSAGSQHQLVPPGVHRALISEQEIQTFKHHFIAGLLICEPKFPLHLWCILIRQAVLTLNLLLPEKLNPHLSAETFLTRAFDLNQTHLDPTITEVLIFEEPGEQLTFSQNRL